MTLQEKLYKIAETVNSKNAERLLKEYVDTIYRDAEVAAACGDYTMCLPSETYGALYQTNALGAYMQRRLSELLGKEGITLQCRGCWQICWLPSTEGECAE